MKIIHTKIRRCGRRVEGGIYMVSAERTQEGVLQVFTMIIPPIPYPAKPHRTIRLVDKTKVLLRAPLEDWWFGSSRNTEEKKIADQWGVDAFGMTTYRRLRTGLCKGMTPDQAVRALKDTVYMKNMAKFVAYFKKLTNLGVPELPRAGAFYEMLHEAIVAFDNTHTQGSLLQVQALIWRIAYAIPPSRAAEITDVLAGMLVLLNMTEDGMAMKEIFSQPL